MQPWIWIVIVVAALLIAAFVIGLMLSRKRRVSIIPTEPVRPVTSGEPAPAATPKANTYKAGNSISFSSGTGGVVSKPERKAPEATPAVHPVAERTETDGQPGVGDDASVPRDSAQESIVEVELPELSDNADELSPEVEAGEIEVAESVELTEVAAVDEADVAADDAAAQPVEEAQEAASAAEQVSVGAEAALAEHAAVAAPELAEPEITVPEVTVPEVTVPEIVAPDVAVPEITTPVPEIPAPGTSDAAELDDIDPTEGRLSRLRGRLSRSQNAFGRSLLGLLGAGTLDEDSWQDVEDTLLMADLGASASADLTAKLRTEVAARGVNDTASARALLREVLVEAVEAGIEDRSIKALPHDGRPAVVLVVGVNGTGKTTTTGKLARVLVADGRKVVLGAADTFRAAAADQLATWGERAGAVVVRSEAGADPAAVAFDAVKRGITDGADAVIIDTAGRLHTKTGLMDELGKVKRVVEKQAKVDEVLLVLDATTGQNGLVQARVFAEVVDITGIVLTKLDGTAKGGIVVAVQRALGVPVKLVGLGEGPDDLAPFEAGAFVDALLG